MMIPYKNVQNLINVLILKLWGWLVFFKNSQITMGVVYFGKALGKSTSKIMISGVKFKIVTKLISVSTPKFWGWLGFSKIHGTPYMWYIFGKPWVREHQQYDPGC